MKTRTFLITGASKGIGRALSDMLAAQGHRVVGVARNANDPTFPGELVAIDLSDRAATDAGLEALVARYDFDGVVNKMTELLVAMKLAAWVVLLTESEWPSSALLQQVRHKAHYLERRVQLQREAGPRGWRRS